MKPFVTSLALASVALSACDGSGSGSATGCDAFRTALSVKDRMTQAVNVFNLGEPITFELQITNTTNAPATLTASSPCTAVVFEVFDSAKQRRWGNGDGIACIQMVQPRTYAPLETVAETAAWSQKDSGGTQVAPGTYVVNAEVGQYVSGSQGQLVDCKAPLSRSATFVIQ